MTIEQQVCSLEIAKRLKGLGCKQDAYWMWRHFLPDEGKSVVVPTDWQIRENNHYRKANRPDIQRRFDEENAFYSAYTVAELGNFLKKVDEPLPYYANRYWYHYEGETMVGGTRTEADARGKMLIHLIENELVKPENL